MTSPTCRGKRRSPRISLLSLSTPAIRPWPGRVSFTVDRSTIHLEVGRIQDYHPLDDRQVVVLPANEYFDDGCVDDASGSLGAYVARHFAGGAHRFTEEIAAELAGVDSHRVVRNGRRAADRGPSSRHFRSGAPA